MWVTAYTDASVKDGKSSWSIWLKCSSGRIVRNGPCPKHINSSTEAETFAAYQAVLTATKEWSDVEGVQINTDSTGILGLFWPWSKPSFNAVMREYQYKVWELKVKIRTKHVKGHYDDGSVRAYLNARVDNLAGAVTGKYKRKITRMEPKERPTVIPFYMQNAPELGDTPPWETV
jgi:hypothetical protein